MTSTEQVLVTGAGGFIGSRLVPGLRDAGYDVICCEIKGVGSLFLKFKLPGTSFSS